MNSLLSAPVSFVADVIPTGRGPMANALPETNPAGPHALARLMIRRALANAAPRVPTVRKEPINRVGLSALAFLALVPCAVLAAGALEEGALLLTGWTAFAVLAFFHRHST